VRERRLLELLINGLHRQVFASDDTLLLWILRDHFGLTGTKFGCGRALCGACTVHMDGVAIRSCVTPVSSVVDKAITTVEGLGATCHGQAVQEAWIALNVPQCGYCQAGQIMSAAALIASNSHPTDADIDAAMAGNICRCGTYARIRRAIKRAAGMLHEDPIDGSGQ
jgi:isoquinoline 1-oxidoreductase subunit alpha